MRPVERVKVNCTCCGAEIEKYPSLVRSNKTGRFFCSAACLKKVGSKPRRRQIRKCQQCAVEFYPQHEETARFCSTACHNAWQGRNRVARTCVVCGEGFDLPPSRAKSEAARYCSKACEGNARVKRPLERTHNGRPARLNTHGYVWVYEPDHPNANRDGWVAEHRLVSEGVLGRVLESDEHVHHINGDKTDNRPQNLAVMTHLEHAAVTGLEIQKRLREWAEYRKRYGPLKT